MRFLALCFIHPTKHHTKLYYSFVIPLSLLLSACASHDDTQELSAQAYYEQAQQAIEQRDFTSAINNLQKLEARYPFGPYTEQAQLEIIYAYYQNDEPEAAAAAADRFIRLHPQHSNVDYAYYMRGLSHYVASESFWTRFLPTDVTQRDPGETLQSFDDFQQLINRFPNSPYATDAQARILFLRARLARFEVNVANYYLARGAYIAALNRGAYVVENYPQTPAVADALAVMVQSYLLLNLANPADDTLVVLRTNFPEHPALNKNGEFDDHFHPRKGGTSWLNKLSLGLIDRSTPPQFDNRAPYLVP